MLIVALPGFSQEIQWYSWNEGIATAKEQEKPIMIFVQASWCHLCKRMDSKVFPEKDIATLLNEKYIPVKLDVETEDLLTWEDEEVSAGKLLSKLSYNKFRGIPAYIFIPSNQKKKSQLEVGLKDPEEMKELLNKYS